MYGIGFETLLRTEAPLLWLISVRKTHAPFIGCLKYARYAEACSSIYNAEKLQSQYILKQKTLFFSLSASTHNYFFETQLHRAGRFDPLKYAWDRTANNLCFLRS